MTSPFAYFSVLWLVYVEVLCSLRKVDQVAAREGDTGSARTLGVQLGALVKCAVMGLLGVGILEGRDGSLFFFATLVVWSALTTGGRVANEYAARWSSQSGRARRRLAAWVGGARMVGTRGLPLAVLVSQIEA